MNVYFQLYASDGTTPVYLFPVVFQANYPYSEKVIIEHNNVRGQGSIITTGGDKAWTLTLKGVLQAADYSALTALIDTMESTIVIDTPYILKINKTVATYYTYYVKRISAIIFDPNNLKNDYIEYEISFLVNSWA